MKVIAIESTCEHPLYAEALSSNFDFVTAVKNNGIIRPGEVIYIKVTPTRKSFQKQIPNPVFVTIHIGNAKVEVPVKFVD